MTAPKLAGNEPTPSSVENQQSQATPQATCVQPGTRQPAHEPTNPDYYDEDPQPRTMAMVDWEMGGGGTYPRPGRDRRPEVQTMAMIASEGHDGLPARDTSERRTRVLACFETQGGSPTPRPRRDPPIMTMSTIETHGGAPYRRDPPVTMTMELSETHGGLPYQSEPQNTSSTTDSANAAPPRLGEEMIGDHPYRAATAPRGNGTPEQKG